MLLDKNDVVYKRLCRQATVAKNREPSRRDQNNGRAIPNIRVHLLVLEQLVFIIQKNARALFFSRVVDS